MEKSTKKENDKIKVIDIMRMISEGKDDFKFRVKYGESYGSLFEVEDGIIISYGQIVHWSICDSWLNSEVKLEDKKAKDSEKEKKKIAEKQVEELFKKLAEEIK